MLLDVRLPDGSGIDFFRQFHEKEPDVPAVMISGHGTIADAVEATRAGAFDFLEKPLSRDFICGIRFLRSAGMGINSPVVELAKRSKAITAGLPAAITGRPGKSGVSTPLSHTAIVTGA